MGEGWLLTGEMLELIDSGINNIVCTQPFGCLPNHVVGKGMVRKIKDNLPQANIVCIDYDPGATRINQENRIKLMLANARMVARRDAPPYRTPRAAAGNAAASSAKPRAWICRIRRAGCISVPLSGNTNRKRNGIRCNTALYRRLFRPFQKDGFDAKPR